MSLWNIINEHVHFMETYSVETFVRHSCYILMYEYKNIAKYENMRIKWRG